MSASVHGRIDWRRNDDKDGNRTYKIRWLVVSTSVLDGPGVIGNASGLATVGSAWAYGNDSDAWALCWPTLSARPVVTREPGFWWVVEQTFSTKPLNRCQDNSIENPLNEPPKISGSFVKYTKEAHIDRNGNKVRSSSHELFRGESVTWDDNRPTVSISLNSLTLPLSTFAAMIDTVNDATLWGLTSRKIKLSNASWERLLYGTCTYYYTMNYEFDVRDTADGFDRKILDEGTKVLSAGGDKTDPTDFEVYKDVNGENTRVLLDGNGNAIGAGADPAEVDFEYYDESNFLSLGIPSSF